MFKNTASQKVTVYAWDSANSEPKTGDAANITAYIRKDNGTPAASDDTNPTEVDATNMKGLYDFTLTQAETNCDKFEISSVSSTADIVIEPLLIYTVPAGFTSQVSQTGDVYAYITAALTEAYGTKTNERTMAELLYEIKSLLTNFATSGTTLTTKKLDGTTAAKTYTFDDASTPTSLIEAT